MKFFPFFRIDKNCYLYKAMSIRSLISVLSFALLTALAPAQVPQAVSAASARLDPTLLELPVIGAEDVILAYSGFALYYDPERLIPDWVAYELTAEELGGEVPRARGFSMDPGYRGRQAMREDYSNSGWDKGHMAPSADMKWSQEAMTESFYLTNICPQDPTLNGRDWHALENRVRDWAQRYGHVWVVCGPVFRDGRYGTIGERAVAVPDCFFKAVLRQEGESYVAIAFVFENNAQRQPVRDAVISVNDVEALIGYDLFTNLDDRFEENIESQVRWEDWTK